MAIMKFLFTNNSCWSTALLLSAVVAPARRTTLEWVAHFSGINTDGHTANNPLIGKGLKIHKSFL